METCLYEILKINTCMYVSYRPLSLNSSNVFSLLPRFFFWCILTYFICLLPRRPVGAATSLHGGSHDPGGAHQVWEPRAAFLRDCATMLERDAAGTAATTSPTAPALSRGGNTTHTHLETTTGQVCDNWHVHHYHMPVLQKSQNLCRVQNFLQELHVL